MLPTKLRPEEGEALVQLAQYSLDEFVRRKQIVELDLARYAPALQAPGASFVTLTAFGELRGCMGVVTAQRPLASDVVENTVAAATRDPRFPPVLPHELALIRLSVTVLTPASRLSFADYDSLLAALNPGLDGVTLQWQGRRAILLPQVWRRIPEPAQFLQALCHKAQIPLAELHKTPPTMAAYTFQTEHFYEAGYLEPGGLTPNA